MKSVQISTCGLYVAEHPVNENYLKFGIAPDSVQMLVWSTRRTYLLLRSGLISNLQLLKSPSSLHMPWRLPTIHFVICNYLGVVAMEGCEVQQVSLDVMPMSPGFLPLPTVYLSKYIPADQKGNTKLNTRNRMYRLNGWHFSMP